MAQGRHSGFADVAIAALAQNADVLRLTNALHNWEALAPEERWWLYTMTVATTRPSHAKGHWQAQGPARGSGRQPLCQRRGAVAHGSARATGAFPVLALPLNLCQMRR